MRMRRKTRSAHAEKMQSARGKLGGARMRKMTTTPAVVTFAQSSSPVSRRVLAAASSSSTTSATSENDKDDMGFEMMRRGVKQAAKENVLTPRFYTTDFEEMDRLFNSEINPNLDMAEFEAVLREFEADYNQTHFVRNEEFKLAADQIDGPMRKIFIEFLERSCTAEFSGFLLYKELGRRLKSTNPVIAKIFSLMSRDEARHAGFLNKSMSDFNLALDLGFLTKNREYTFFKPKFIFYATYLSEKIGYWRYITIYRNLQKNPDSAFYPIFNYFENWCQDENRHGDFFSALLKAQPQFIDGGDWQAKLWCRFFCLSVYVTMYLNDHQRQEFYQAVGLETTQFNKHVIIETNKTTMRIFPAVLDVENPEFFSKMDRLVVLNTELNSLDDDDALKGVKSAGIIAQMVTEILALFLMKPIEGGSVDMPESAAQPVF